jgi:UDP:flavonoid glycosyltransferase YjiC (YdhE family)
MRRVLLVSENLSFSQVVRLVSLGRRLDPTRYEVHFACSAFDPLFFAGTDFRRWPLYTVDHDLAWARMDAGQSIYDSELLAAYVEAELALLEEVKPDLVIGDFRLTLSLSAELGRVRSATLVNAYWSPFSVHPDFPVPDHPLVDAIGVERATRYFPDALSAALAANAAPINELRQRHGLAPLKGMREVMSHGDFTLYPDSPELCPTRDLPAHHHYLGPVFWSPQLPLDAELLAWAQGQPFVYVTLGSSGRLSALSAVLEALARLPVRALLATAERALPAELPANVRAAAYVPGQLAARAARFVITNGGASTSHQALGEGKPVLGVPSNMDQYLSMAAIERAGAGLLLRAGTITTNEAQAAMVRLLEADDFERQARAVRDGFARLDCHEQFAQVLQQCVPSS